MKIRMKFIKLWTIIALILASISVTQAVDWWASAVSEDELIIPRSFRLGGSPYDSYDAVLGKPSTWINNSEEPGILNPCAVSMVYGAWNTGLQGEKLVTTIRMGTTISPAGYIIVKFEDPIYDDPDNWYGKDFIIFGNSFFAHNGENYLNNLSNMENITISAYDENIGNWEPMLVSVSQDGINWEYIYSNGPYADDFAPTHAFAWDWIENRWLKNSAGCEVELDFTKPLDPSFSITDFDSKTVAQAIDMYRGSGGGTSFDLADLPLPVDPVTGRKWIKYIRIEGDGGEIDAFARVSHAITPISIGEAKKLPDGARVELKEAVVSAGTYEVGRYCYVQHEDCSSGIKIIGRVIERDKIIRICGVMDTIDGERVILPTAVETIKDDQGNDRTSTIRPLGMTNKSVGGGDFEFLPEQNSGQKGVDGGVGLNNIGLLVKTWGRVKSVDSASKSFVIDDASGRLIKCVAPRDTQADDPDKGSVFDPNFTLPAQGEFISVTGINSCEENGENGLLPVIRLRNQDGWQLLYPQSDQ